jgi:hypothetical protein
VSQPDFPQAFREADRASLEAQRTYIRATRGQLLLLVVAGGIAVLEWRHGRLDPAALVAGTALVLAAALRTIVLRRAPHRRWYEARAAAESAKSLGWRYSVGGSPFGIAEAGAEPFFREQLTEIFHSLQSVRSPEPAALQPTEWMRALRGSDRAARRETYRTARIQDQIAWYSAKAEWNRVRARFWSLTVLVFQVTGAAGAFLKGFGVVDLDLFGLAAAVAASGAAWAEAKQHGNLASAYRVAADELRKIDGLINEERTEQDWARFVGEAEGAISREHTMWRAASSHRGPADLF